MKALIVSATPEPQSFIASMAKTSQRVLENMGYEVETSDLYEMNWNPVASAEDFGNRSNPEYLIYALEQRNGVKDQTIAPDIQRELDKLLAADVLVLNFPIYWFSTPAIMKGWFDRVLVSGVCYGGLRFYDQGGLKGKKVLVGASLGGQPHMFGTDGIHGPIHDMLRHFLRGTLAYSGMDVLEPFFAWHVPYISEEARVEMMDSYAQHLSLIDTLPVLDAPSMSDFTKDLHPLASPPASTPEPSMTS
jgi:NAD(P)H dehydrogenase (quinone)